MRLRSTVGAALIPSHRRLVWRGLSLTPVKTISIAIETNEKGLIGFLVDLPGAFTRGRSETEVLEKAPAEARSYLRWLGTQQTRLGPVKVVERHESRLTVEDADSEILLTADMGTMDQPEFRNLSAIVRKSGETFVSLVESCTLKDWVDPSRVRRTFYGETPSTIQQMFNHVAGTQRYYLSRIRIDIEENESLLSVRKIGLRRIGELLERQGNSETYNIDGESWTIKKVLRRFVWHDRIHGKAITRILAKQKRLGLIESYEDSFRFGIR